MLACTTSINSSLHGSSTVMASAHTAHNSLLLVPIALSMMTVGCFSDPFIAGSSTDGGTDGSTDGDTTDTGTDAGSVDAGTPFDGTPAILRPINGAQLTPTRAFLFWQDGELPPVNEKSISGYQVCQSSQGLPSIDGPDLCPNAIQVTTQYDVIDSLAVSSQYYWKVRTVYSDASFSNYSDIAGFSTDNSLIGWWRMDDGAGGTAIDSSSVGNSGTLTNFNLAVAWTQGHVGGAVNFDGVNDFITIGNVFNFDSTDAFSIEAWTRRDSAGSDHTILSNADYTNPSLSRGFWFGYDASDHLNFVYTSDNSADNRLRIDSMMTFAAPGTMQSVAVTYDGSTLASGAKFFLGGAELASIPVYDNLNGTTLSSIDNRIGGSVDLSGAPTATQYNFHGLLDDVAVYNRSLTSEEIINNNCAREVLAGTMPLPQNCQ